MTEHLIFDQNTREDLDLFGEDEDHDSLFDFCNQCRTEAGMKALRQRMETPWCTAEKIRDTQSAIRFIQANRGVFNALPTAYLALNVERYITAVMPIVRPHAPVEFFMSAFSMWANDTHFYTKIIRGVQLSHRLLKGLAGFVEQLAALKPSGELAALAQEMEALISKPEFANLQQASAGRWFWEKLRADQTFRLFHKNSITRLLALSAEVDALVSMADVTQQNNLTLPEIESGEVRIQADALVHPLMAEAVANPVDLDQTRRVLFLTGPNMAGKTTYLRAIATALYMAHLGMGVPARRFSFVPVRCLLTSISLSDNLNDGISYFRAEALRVKAVAQAIADGHATVAIMDEPFKGTNIKDAFDASLAMLQRLANSQASLFVVSSHLIELKDQLDQRLPIDYRYFEAEEGAERLRFDYVLHEGVSAQRLGMRVLQEEGVFELLDTPPKP